MKRIRTGFAWILSGILLGLGGFQDSRLPVFDPPHDFGVRQVCSADSSARR